MSAVKIGYNDQYQSSVDYLCIQQPNVRYIRSTASSIIDEEEQQKRERLIQAATDRLRQKLLENKYETLMSQIVELQSKLDIIKLETSISLKSMSTEHLDHFEKRLENHKLQLQTIVKHEEVEKNKNKFSSSLSSFSSTISSILSLRSTSDEEEKDYYASLGHQQIRRRRHSKHQKRTSHVPIVTIDDSYYTTTPKESSDNGRNGLLVLHSIQDHNSQSEYNNDLINIGTPSIPSTRNALDDTLSFLNDLASDSDDGGFRQDITQLLDTMHPVQQTQPRPKCFFRTQTRSTCFVKKALTSIVSSSWKWIRFALIMALAILINLRKGPSLF